MSVTSTKALSHIELVRDLLGGFNFQQEVMEFVDYLAFNVRDARASDGTVYVMGNGGSAANASHLALHIVDSGTKAVALADNSALLSASGNDHGMPESFMRSMPYSLRSDVLVAFSCSGTSDNIKRAIAQFKGTVLAVFGPGSPMQGQAFFNVDAVLRIPSDDYGVIEDMQSILVHMATKLFSVVDRP
jgi:D-sedoheptulose 7-phosphate isomerase